MRKNPKNPRTGGTPSSSYHRREAVSTRREDIVPYFVLGLSFGALALSVYAVTGGPVDEYIASRQPYVAHADNQVEQVTQEPTPDSNDINEILGKGTYDITVTIDDDGERSYVLTPIESDETDVVDEPDSDLDSDSDSESVADADSDSDNDDAGDSELSDEAKETLEEHKSMRLRKQPDRDGSDIYYYVVEAGDRLADISSHFDVPLGQLMEDNHIENGDMIYVGEVIFMPTGFSN